MLYDVYDFEFTGLGSDSDASIQQENVPFEEIERIVVTGVRQNPHWDLEWSYPDFVSNGFETVTRVSGLGRAAAVLVYDEVEVTVTNKNTGEEIKVSDGQRDDNEYVFVNLDPDGLLTIGHPGSDVVNVYDQNGVFLGTVPN